MKKKKILFVCLGNICRSPAAEAVMKSRLEQHGLSYLFEVDSAGTIAYHAGETADRRMKMHAAKRGYNLTSIARKFNEETDFERYDYIITMDNQNYSNVKALDKMNNFSEKIFRMTEFSKRIKTDEVPDPYYRGDAGFENVLDILEDTSEGLIEKLKNESA
jgi:protein-tyrosine phosphatase